MEAEKGCGSVSISATQVVFRLAGKYDCMQEEELRCLQEAHVKKMTRLNYELEQVRTEGEWPTHKARQACQDKA